MTGTEELLNLAALMRVFADTARKIADARAKDRSDIYVLSWRAEELANAFEEIGRRDQGGPELN